MLPSLVTCISLCEGYSLTIVTYRWICRLHCIHRTLIIRPCIIDRKHSDIIRTTISLSSKADSSQPSPNT